MVPDPGSLATAATASSSPNKAGVMIKDTGPGLRAVTDAYDASSRQFGE